MSPGLLRLASKLVLMPALAGRFARAPHGNGFHRVLAAQTLSWGGDLALVGRSRVPFLTGLSLFLAAHVSYVSAYRSRSSQPLLATSGRRAFVATGGVLTAGMTAAAAREDRAVALPVAAYGATLVGMVASAAAIDRDRGRDRVLAGSVLFLVSDALIGVRRFLLGDRAPALGAAIMATYTVAQWSIGDGMQV